MHIVLQFFSNQLAEGKQSIFSSDLPENWIQRRALFHSEGYQEIPALTMCFSCRGKASSEAFQTVGDFAPFKDTSEASVDLVMKRNLLNLDSCALAAFHYLAVKISRSVGTYPNTEAFLSFFFFFFEENERRSYFPTPSTIEKARLVRWARKIRLLLWHVWHDCLSEQTALPDSPTPERAGTWQPKENTPIKIQISAAHQCWELRRVNPQWQAAKRIPKERSYCFIYEAPKDTPPPLPPISEYRISGDTLNCRQE